MSPFSHGNIVVAIIGCCLICFGNLRKETENKDDRPGPSMSRAASGRLSGQQRHHVLRDPDTSPVLSASGMETQNSKKKTSAEMSVSSAVMTAAPYRGLDGKPVNLTQFLAFLQQQEFRRQLNRDAEWAYVCVVVVICTMMFMMWWLGGLQHCRCHSDETTPFASAQPLVSVHEVLKKQKQYLPMFNEPEQWAEVVMCDRATDP